MAKQVQKPKPTPPPKPEPDRRTPRGRPLPWLKEEVSG